MEIWFFEIILFFENFFDAVFDFLEDSGNLQPEMFFLKKKFRYSKKKFNLKRSVFFYE